MQFRRSPLADVADASRQSAGWMSGETPLEDFGVNSLHKLMTRLPAGGTFLVNIEYPIVGTNDITRLWFSLQEQRVLIYHLVPFTSGGGLMVECGWKRFLLLHQMVMGALSNATGWSPFNPKQAIKTSISFRFTRMSFDSLDEKDCRERYARAKANAALHVPVPMRQTTAKLAGRF